MKFKVKSKKYIYSTISWNKSEITLKMKTFCHIYVLFFCGLYIRTVSGSNGALAKKHCALAAEIVNNLADSHADKNVLFSPLSIHTTLTLVYLGAKGETAQELEHVLSLNTSEKAVIATDYADLLDTNFGRRITNVDLNMANGFFVDRSMQLTRKFETQADHFKTHTKRMNFTESEVVRNAINSWVEENTNSKIKNLLKPNSIDSQTKAILINAIYFKALWELPFDKEATQKANFFLNLNKRVQVDMMYNQGRYRCGTISKLNAKVLELPYKSTNITMLIVLPNEVEGLNGLEKKLKKENIDWNNAAANLHSMDDVRVFLPKFKIEFDMNLKKQLKKLGVSKIFSHSAEFSDLFKSNVTKIQKIQHKAFLEVEETGSEAAAATFVSFGLRSFVETVDFRVDRPFLFVIRNRGAVFFIGHIAKF